MRNRLVSTYVLLLCMVLAALEVPFAIALCNRETERVVADRLADATRFASLAAPALRSGELESLKDELLSYYTLYGIATMLVDQDQPGLRILRGDDFGLVEGPGRLTGRQHHRHDHHRHPHQWSCPCHQSRRSPRFHREPPRTEVNTDASAV